MHRLSGVQLLHPETGHPSLSLSPSCRPAAVQSYEAVMSSVVMSLRLNLTSHGLRNLIVKTFYVFQPSCLCALTHTHLQNISHTISIVLYGRHLDFLRLLFFFLEMQRTEKGWKPDRSRHSVFTCWFPAPLKKHSETQQQGQPDKQ